MYVMQLFIYKYKDFNSEENKEKKQGKFLIRFYII